MEFFKKQLRKTATLFLFAMLATPVIAVTGEMGTGKPDFGLYTATQGIYTKIWVLREATVNFPIACTGGLVLSPATMGMESYKIAVSILTIAKMTNAAVRFYATVDRGQGCEVDYLQLV
jgi:hypothetical protein